MGIDMVVIGALGTGKMHKQQSQNRNNRKVFKGKLTPGESSTKLSQ
jgi:hypothetical protein